MASMSNFINYCFRSLSLPLALAILSAICIVLALAVSSAAFLVLNGGLPPNFVAVVAITTVVASVPLILQAMPTIRRLQDSRDNLVSARNELMNQVTELDIAARALDDARMDLENRIDRRTRELDAARSAAEDANRAKSAFLAQMSHELRTPLNAIIGFSEVMMTPGTLPLAKRMAEVEDYSGIINSSGKHLLSLVNDLLDMSKIEAGKLDLHIERIDLSTLMSDAERVIAPLALARGQTLLCLLDPQAGALEADRRALMQILLNLMSNAVKYSPPKTTIMLSCTGIGNDIAFTVRDEGKGMTEEGIRRAREPFTRLSNAETAGQSGTGLGLYIVASLAEAQGGALAITSTPGAGTEARVSLPHRVVANRLPTTARPVTQEKKAVA